ncbi:zinc finger CCCH domain-containing protein 16 [Cucurbita pepo subsp. pepo]|uniref:zinc finger CCCH domain-containing protein 16 n=1 Tax=Cucurbita pepo subsp. pepo TaxID=3664 RepID=UPI000C9D681E|nr:zinc finger CCCH domain-containing protein 16 [Cucurbita pepo subsp. pepo]XP_023520668.1 zinc finger CCCH domain-containing protein 16 [Cucurbita pepo subsp. pepo]XP_023520669.1 zinc finger CCCH domain-containing protein 16 [Cucurbita pepo subsp. pepo]
MHYKKEPCRNFQRGSCQYGERCKFLHVTQQPQKPSNFGSGMQTSSQPQQKPNPFGFGVHSTGQSKAAVDSGSKQNQYKLYDNKWTRSSTPTGNAPSRKPDNQPASANHICTDGESCKRQIAEDFQNERPLWKLTCYGHSKSQPCDIVGDVSYEELRAIAYDEAKRGISLQSIVERERNLLNSKLSEFESLLHKPYVTPLNRASGNQSSLSGTNSLSVQPSSQNSGPPSLSSFSQLGASLNTGFGARPSNPPNNAFGQPVQFSSSPENSSTFGATNFPSTNAGAVGGVFGSQVPSQTFGNSTLSGFNNSGITNAGSNLLSSPAIPTKFPSTDAGGQILSNAQLVNKLQQENSSVDVSIWLKEKWVPGEIPEVAPPDAVVQ